MQRVKTAVLSFLTLAVLMAGGGPSWAVTIRDVRLGLHPDKTRMVFDLSAGTEFRAFTLSSPWRIAIDLPDMDWRAGAVARPAGSMVRDVRQGELQPGIARVVVDLDRPVVIRSAFILPADGAKPDRLVIDFAAASEAGALDQKDRVHGRLAVAEKPDRIAVLAPHARTPDAAPVAPVPPPPPRREEAVRSEPPPEVSGSAMVVPARKPLQGESAEPAPAARTTEKPLVIIDPGHGGADPGAIGANGLQEKKITLAMAKELEKQLEATGRYRVRLTRESDAYMRLYKRVDFARKEEGDLFISLHADSIDKPGVRGASVYTLSDKASDAQTEMLALRENRADLIAGVDLSHEDEVVAGILVDLTLRDTMNQSRFLANTVADSLREDGVRLLDNAHRYAGFAVLKAPDVPSVLVEMGFMSNRNDAEDLSRPAFQKTLAAALVDSIDAYFARLNDGNRT